ncbi:MULTISPECIES: substrate-binding domain-containing protein [unclassified Paenibacillus]|uniref:substrate-binding domain-containing protein n=1 Tax=unclassified Paenibacillus TaxID=185978 RepID=UPI001AEA0210|nr:MULTISPECIES: substrate-binding domain-containing protein [unclassified Paenibacillus]MBP1157297.1 ribose transport system substrate-binding protein [Paenibacillus sp. PvP091]MBP1171964.1 ribose transport system substrate-binding protein [Paenibacillus sp. PvR098]MBP2438345.1 ribose transport system substrate-binding protein [Paenibacillus sp. PvP052]
MKKNMTTAFILMLALSLTLMGCGKQGSTGTDSAAQTNTNYVNVSGPLTINPSIPDLEVLDKGPNGEQAVSAKSLQLTEEELQKIKDGKYKAAIVMHYSGTDYMTAAVNAMKDTFAKMGIEVVAVTDAQFKAEKQVNDIETVLAKKPDIMISVPVDSVSTAGAYRKAVQQGVKLVFMDGAADGLAAGKDYVSVVSGDNYGNGVLAADIMAEKIGGQGKVGLVYHDVNFFVTKNRSDAFEATIKAKYPNIEIVAKGGITDPNKGQEVAAAMLTRNPDIKGIFAPWDVPAEGVMAAARTAGRNDLVVTTVDLGTNVALSIASNGIVQGLGAQLPYDQGVAQAILAGYGILGKEAPAYVASPAIKVTKENVLDNWKLIYGVDAPASVQNALKK